MTLGLAGWGDQMANEAPTAISPSFAARQKGPHQLLHDPIFSLRSASPRSARKRGKGSYPLCTGSLEGSKEKKKGKKEEKKVRVPLFPGFFFKSFFAFSAGHDE
jgi:hypothetical protein